MNERWSYKSHNEKKRQGSETLNVIIILVKSPNNSARWVLLFWFIADETQFPGKAYAKTLRQSLMKNSATWSHEVKV